MRRKTLCSHEDLEVWKLARQMVGDIYRLTARMPVTERFGLQAQIRRAAVSVVSNIAEGAARNSTAEFRRFIGISLGSLAELETQCLVCEDLQFLVHNESLHRQIRGIRPMLASLRRSLLARRRIGPVSPM
jgi:four helix bundle protein